MSLIYKSVAAREDLINIWRYTYAQWGESQADQHTEDVEKALELLADEPLISFKGRTLAPSSHSSFQASPACLCGSRRRY